MKVAIITPNYFPEVGACASRMRYMATGLEKAGHQVTIFTALPNYPTGSIFPKYQQRFFQKETLDKLPIYRYWVFATHSGSIFKRALGMLSMAFSLFFCLPSLLRMRPDVLLVQSPPLLLGLTGAVLAKLTGAKLILNVSDLYPQVLLDLEVISKKSLHYRLLSSIELFLYKKAKLILGQSQEILTHIEQFVSAQKTLLYRNGTALAFEKAEKKPENKLKIVYAGLLGVSQDVLNLCKAIDFEELGAELHIYGDGFERKAIEAYSQQHPEKSIFLHEVIHNGKLKTELSQYDIAFVIQKRRIYGTVPSKIYEAMAVGLPVLLCGAGESAEIVQKNQVGWVVAPSDYAGIQQTIEQIQNSSPQVRSQFSENGQKAASKHFNRASFLTALLEKLKSFD